jgi:hypothetical protein
MISNQILPLSPDLDTFFLLFNLLLMKISKNPYSIEKVIIKINFIFMVVKWV